MSSRKAFEKWAHYAGDRNTYGPYSDRDVTMAWEVWKAATERAAKICDLQHDLALTSTGAHRADCCSVCIRDGNE